MHQESKQDTSSENAEVGTRVSAVGGGIGSSEWGVKEQARLLVSGPGSTVVIFSEMERKKASVIHRL